MNIKTKYSHAIVIFYYVQAYSYFVPPVMYEPTKAFRSSATEQAKLLLTRPRSNKDAAPSASRSEPVRSLETIVDSILEVSDMVVPVYDFASQRRRTTTNTTVTTSFQRPK